MIWKIIKHNFELLSEPNTAEVEIKESHKSANFDEPILLEKSSKVKTGLNKSKNLRKEGI